MKYTSSLFWSSKYQALRNNFLFWNQFHDLKKVIIYQHGKAGSSSLYESFLRLSIPVFHCHALYSTSSILESFTEYGQFIPNSRLNTMHRWHKAHSALFNGSLNKPIILVPFRDPIPTLISGLCQNIYRMLAIPFINQHPQLSFPSSLSFSPQFEQNPIAIDFLLDNYYQLFLHFSIKAVSDLFAGTANYLPNDDTLNLSGKYTPFQWFTKRFEIDLRLSLNSFNFLPSNGYSISETQYFTSIVFNVSKIDSIISLMRSFLCSPKLQLIPANLTIDKPINQFYSDLSEGVKLPLEIKSQISSNPIYNKLIKSPSYENFGRFFEN